MDTATLLSGLWFSSIGVGYLMYGKKQQRQAAVFSGLALLGDSFLVSDLWVIWGVGMALVGGPVLSKN